MSSLYKKSSFPIKKIKYKKGGYILYAKKEHEKEGYLSCARRCFQPRRESRSLSNLKMAKKSWIYDIMKKGILLQKYPEQF